MRVDVLTIFPDYLRALDLSLPGKAQRNGLLDLRVHDLRTWTHDRHRTVDDTPYGGGAGMVMKPEPWGEAFDELGVDESVTVLVPTPSGEVFTQRLAHELAGQQRLVIGCGRYEGIDARVVADAAARGARVREVSLGDYVLNGGEVAALAILEAVIRLLPGFMGNPESLVEESHADGELGALLEYPVYTKPATWRGLEVPPVLLSGDHGAIEQWRRGEAARRTATRRPDLLAPATLAGLGEGLAEGPVDGSGEYAVTTATAGDAGELLTLTRACWVSEALANDTLRIGPLHETLDDVTRDLSPAPGQWHTLVVRSAGRLVGSVRTRRTDDSEGRGMWHIGRLMVAPDLRGRGLGRALLAYAERRAAPRGEAGEGAAYELFTGARREANLRLYRRAGYRITAAPGETTEGTVTLTKPAQPRKRGRAAGTSSAR